MTETLNKTEEMEKATTEAFMKLSEKEKNNMAGCLRIMEEQEENWLELLITFATAQMVMENIITDKK